MASYRRKRRVKRSLTRRHRGGAPKNVALLFAGRIKAYEHNEKLKAIKDKFNATVFCSINKKNKSDYIKKFCETFDITDERLNLEHTVAPDWMKGYKKTPETLYDHTYSQYYNRFKAFELLEKYQKHHNMKFDCIIFMRVDMDSSLSPELEIGDIKPNTLYVPETIYDWSGLNDQMAYGDFDTMKIYCDVVHNIKKMCEEQDLTFHAESMLKKHIENSGLHLERFRHFYRLHDKRKEYNPDYNNHA